MPTIRIRSLPDEVYASLLKIATKRGVSIEAVAREALKDLANTEQGGIDFKHLERTRAALGLSEDGPEWTAELDDPALSRCLLGVGE